MKTHKFLVIGLGSMGRRRIRNLISIGYSTNDIIGVDIKKERRLSIKKDYEIFAYEKIDKQLLDFADIFIISTPPDSHFESGLVGLKNNKHIFIEASVISRGLCELYSEASARNLVAFPSCTMRYFEGPKNIKRLISTGLIGKPLFWQYQSGQYLPDWHPWERIEDYYVSNPETGGCREIVPFELVWLEDIFGSIEEVDCRTEKISTLPASINDIYFLMLKHEGGVLGQLIVDVLSRAPVRFIRVTGTLGSVEWTDDSNTLRIFDTTSRKWNEEALIPKNLEKDYINSEKPYEDEIRDFLAVVNGDMSLKYTLKNDLEILKVLEAAESASSLPKSHKYFIGKFFGGRFKNKSLQRKSNEINTGGAHTYSKGDDQFPKCAPSFIDRGMGAWVWDSDANKFLDWGMGLRSVSLGHAYEPVLDSIRSALLKGVNFTRPSLIEGELAELLVDLIPSAEMVKFAKNGSDVTTAAIKLSRAATGRDIVIRCYDQPFFSVDDWFIGDTTMNAGIPNPIKELTKNFRFNDVSTLENILINIGHQVACIILEPAFTEVPQKGFLEKVRILADRYGAVLIFDEIITGFRWHISGAQKFYNVLPDLSTFGKAMGNGFSVAALTGRREIMELAGIDHPHPRVFALSSTNGAETHSLAAAIKTIKELSEKKVIDDNWKIGCRLMSGFNNISEALGISDRIKMRGIEVSPWISCTQNDGLSPDQYLRTFFLQEMIHARVLMPYISISASHREEELKFTLNAVEKVLNKIAPLLHNNLFHNYINGPIVKPVFRKFN